MRWHRSLAPFLPTAPVGPVLRTIALLASLIGCLGTVAGAAAQSASLEETKLAPPSPACGSEYGDVVYNPSEARLLAEARRGEVDGRWLFEAALAADGVTDSTALADYRRQWESWREQVSAQLKEPFSPSQRARTIFTLLHCRALGGGYAADATGLQAALDGAGYNCVSATILFNSLATVAGLNVAAIETPEHVYSVVRSGDGEFAVEMTCLRWFDLSADAQRQALAERSPDFDLSSTAGARRELGPAGLVALVYYNAGVDHLSRGEFRESLSANLKAMAFDPANSLARGNLLATLNNWALARYEARDYATAAQLIEYGRRVAPDHRPYKANLAAIYERWSEQLLADGQPAQAHAVAARSRQCCPDTGP